MKQVNRGKMRRFSFLVLPMGDVLRGNVQTHALMQVLILVSTQGNPSPLV
jgi:hypothetical protein